MEADRQKTITSSLPIIAILAVISAGLFLSRSPLKSLRPQAPAGLTQPVREEGKIDARLWQDPLKVALEHKKAMHPKGKDGIGASATVCGSAHCVNQITDRLNKILPEPDTYRDIPIVRILLVIVRDGNFAEDHERRLRNRYALLTALRASGMAPTDTQHIQYFELHNSVTIGPNSDGRRVDNGSHTGPLIVPFEWFEREALCPVEVNDHGTEHVLVLWLGESDFSSRPLRRLAQVIDELAHAHRTDVEVDVIGPSRSTTLRAMLGEIADSNEPELGQLKTELNRLRIYSPWSTASPALLVEEWPTQNLDGNDSMTKLYEVIPAKFNEIGIKFMRMIGSDDLLAMHLINELRRRGVDVLSKGDRECVVLIYEWDTFYGKAFPLTFATMMECIDPDMGEPRNWAEYAKKLNERIPSWDGYFPPNLHAYSYIRGVDGRLPESESAQEKQQNEDTESEFKLTYADSLELPTGRGQLDYVRRLAEKLHDKYRYLGPHRLRAIGVVASDVYDKLIVLHALREEFSDVPLFMTDLDARLLHPQQRKWTRNVVVASNYGFELAQPYQRSEYHGTAPPFRDNYQTALFLACRTALGLSQNTFYGQQLFRDMRTERWVEWISQPRLFEVGRGRAVDLSLDNPDIHPPRHNLATGWELGKNIWPLLRTVLLVFLAIAFSILLVIQISPRVMKVMALAVPRPRRWKARELIDKILSPQSWNRLAILAKLVALSVILFVAVVIVDHYRPGGEPFSLTAGVSIWPGQALRLLALILSLYFLFIRSWDELKENEKEMCKEFGLKLRDKDTPFFFTQWRKQEKASGRSRNIISDWLRYRIYYIGILGWKLEEPTVPAEKLWKDYLIRATRRGRFYRLILISLAYGLLACTLMLTFGPPYTPYRGTVSSVVDKLILAPNVIFMILLMFFVVDATHLCLRVVYAMIKHRNWAKADKFFEQSELKPTDLESWLDVRFIARLTEGVGKLIYYPFIVVLITVVARVRYFDNWGFPIALVIVLLVYLFHVLGCAIALQVAARRARRTAIDDLQRTLEQIKFSQRKRARQIEYLVDEIESLRQGAFRPFFENPVIHVLVGSGGAGLIALLRFFPAS